VVLLHYPLDLEMDETLQRADLEFYSERTDSHGPAMTWGKNCYYLVYCTSFLIVTVFCFSLIDSLVVSCLCPSSLFFLIILSLSSVLRYRNACNWIS
jgi:hypothetical protein